MYGVVVRILQLRVHQAMNAVPHDDHTLDPFLSHGAQIWPDHDGVLPVIYPVIYHGIGVRGWDRPEDGPAVDGARR